MAVYYCDDGGDNTTGAAWSTAKTTFAAALALCSAGDTIYIGHNHAETLTAANTTHLGGSSSGFVSAIRVISATQGSSPVAYQAATGVQFGTSSASDYSLTFSRSWYFHGVSVSCGGILALNSDLSACTYAIDSSFECGTGDADGYASFVREGHAVYLNCTFTNSRTATDAKSAWQGGTNGHCWLYDCTFTSATPARITGTIIQPGPTQTLRIIGGDCSAFTSAAHVIDENGVASFHEISGMKLPSGVSLLDGQEATHEPMTNYTRLDANTYSLGWEYWHGTVDDSTLYTRTGGATDGTAYSWVVTTTADCIIGNELKTPWSAIWVDSTGSATVDMYITSTDALTDTECWMEVEYHDTASSSETTITTTRNADPLATGTTLTTGGTWSDTGLIEYKLSKSVTLGIAGFVRARVVFATDLTATLDTRTGECYVCPEVEVS